MALFVGWVSVILFIDVAVATPIVGVVNVGDTIFANVPEMVGKVNATAVVLLPINDILPAVVTVV